MALHVIHFEHRNRAQWGVIRGGHITPIPGDCASTADFIRAADVTELAGLGGETIKESEVKLLSPVTRNQQFICQGANYRQHMYRVRHGPGREDLQHDLHQGHELHRARRP